MRIFCFFLLAATLVLSGTATERRPNIVMIAIDDLNNWVGALGGPAHTPNIDRLAASGRLFTNASCVTPACNPSRVALMTGLRPETTGQYENEGNFRRKRPGNDRLLTLPQRLQSLGYRTIGAGKIFHQGRGAGPKANDLSDPVSWDEQYVGGTGTGGAQAYLDEKGWAKWLRGDDHGITNSYGLRSALWGPIEERKEDTADWKMVGFCADVIGRKHDQPYFLAAGIFRPHAPLLAPKEFFDLYPLDKVHMPYVPPDEFADIPAIARENWSTPLVRAMQQEGEWQRAVQAYLACLSFADACVGRILDAIDRSPDRDNTIVILWGDHGWQLGHKDRWEKFSLWKQSTQAPLIIRSPGFAPGPSARAVSFLDVTPTVLELVGAAVPAGLEGASLTPQLRDPAARREKPAVVTYMPGNHSVVFEGWNYIRYANGSEELYQHATDPAEYTNLIGQPVAEKIVALLRPHLPATPPADLTRNVRTND